MATITNAATAKLTIGSVLGTVTSAATSVQSLFDTATTGIEMINTEIKNASFKQQKRIAVDQVDYVVSLAETKSAEIMERKIKISEALAQSEQHVAYYNEAYTQMAKVLNLPTKEQPET